MMEILQGLLLLVSLYIGWNIGANDGANCFGTSVGAGIINFRNAAILVAIFAFIGAALQGGPTISTVGKGIVNPIDLTYENIFAALLGASLLVTIFTIKGIPVSTTQSVVGAIMGIGLWFGMNIEWGLSLKLLGGWLLTPFIAALFSFLSYIAITHLSERWGFEFFTRRIHLLVLASGILLSYSLGANNIGNAMGLVVSIKLIGPVIAGFVGGLFLAIGTVTYGKNVMMTVGTKITTLDSTMAFAAQSGAAITMMILTFFAIPTSTTHAIIGGIAGIGLVKGMATIDRNTVYKIIRGWFLTPILGAFFAIVISTIISLF